MNKPKQCMNVLERILSVKNDGNHKVITICGIKVKIKSRLRELHSELVALRGIKDELIANRRLLYQNCNKIKEIDLKHKVRLGKKVKTVFLIDCITRFPVNDLYKKMAEGDFFAPYILPLVLSNSATLSDNQYNTWSNMCNCLERKGFKVIRTYDDNKKLIPIEQHKPDILFYSMVYAHSIAIIEPLYLNHRFLTCYLPYGMNTIDNFDYHYNSLAINTTWKFFCDTYYDYESMILHTTSFGNNCVLSGSPKLDEYKKDIKDCVIPEKISNGNKIVIYAPHWTIGMGNTYKSAHPECYALSTFHLYYKNFLEFVKKHSDINFVFKPHPVLRDRCRITGFLSENEYDSYVKEWDSLPNGLYVNDNEYIDLFRMSSCLITDCGSFIGEYLPSGSPCIYLIKPERCPERCLDIYNDFGRKILDTYYLARSQDEIQDWFEKVVLEGHDPKKEMRLKVLRDEFINIGSASEKIIDYLEEVLEN